MSIVDKTNANTLHDIADKLDCPPLKLTSWHILQDSRYGYGTNPNRLLPDGGFNQNGNGQPPMLSSYLLKGSGLTGPGEDGNRMYLEGAGLGEDGGSDEGGDEHLSVFNDYTQGMKGESEDAESLFPLPEQLPPNAPAADVIKAWAYRLQLVYDMCVPPEDPGPSSDTRDLEDYYNEDAFPQGDAGANDYENNNSNSGQNLRSRSDMSENALIKQRLVQFYAERNLHEKISSVDNVLASFKNKEGELFEALRSKYDDPNSPNYIPIVAGRKTQNRAFRYEEKSDKSDDQSDGANMTGKSRSSKRFGLF